MPFFSNQSTKCQTRGFTLIEMIVVIGIFLVMTGILLVNLPKFKDKTNLDLIAQELAVTIRQAQVYGTAVHTFGTGSEAVFPSYGIYIDSSRNAKKMVLFADIPPSDGQYGGAISGNGDPFTCAGANPECVEVFNIEGAAMIDSLIGCSTPVCSSPAPISSINIVYLRPNPEAKFYNLSGQQMSFSQLKISLKSTKSGGQKTVAVFANGQIRVEN